MKHLFSSEEIEAERKEMEAVRVNGGRTDFDNEYAMYRYMVDGEVPTHNDYGHEIDQKLAKAYITERETEREI